MNEFETPPMELEITQDCVRLLVESQYPKLAKAPLEAFASGWDNVMYRAGEAHLIRLPRRQTAVPLITNEQLVLPLISSHLPRPVPAPLYVGTPQHGYPWTWSVVPWIEGQPVAHAPLNAQGALELAEFWAALHNLQRQLYPSDATPNPFRGMPLAKREDAFHARATELNRLGEPLSKRHEDIWHIALNAPRSTTGVIIQGDPHARNVLSDRGRLAAVIDWGDVTWGDAASDLASFWMLIHDSDGRRVAIDRYASLATHADAAHQWDALMQRSRGWALLYATMLRVTGLADNPTHAQMGLQTLHNLAAVD